MSDVRLFLISQAGKPVTLLEAKDEQSALARAKGLGNILELSPSLPMQAAEATGTYDGIPVFRTEYFEMLGFTS